MEPWSAIGVVQALRAAVSARDAVRAVRIERAAVIVIHFAFNANKPQFVAAVRRRRTFLVFGAALRTDPRGQVASVVARAILIESTLDAAMERRIATSEAARLAVEIGHTFEARSALQVAA